MSEDPVSLEQKLTALRELASSCPAELSRAIGRARDGNYPDAAELMIGILVRGETAPAVASRMGWKADSLPQRLETAVLVLWRSLSSDTTAQLLAWQRGDYLVGRELLERKYLELRRRAAAKKAKGPRVDASAESILHDIFIRFDRIAREACRQSNPRWKNSSFFEAYFEKSLVNAIRRRATQESRRADLTESAGERGTPVPIEQRIDLKQALELMRKAAPLGLQVLILRELERMTLRETAASLGISVAVVRRLQREAMAFLKESLEGSNSK